MAASLHAHMRLNVNNNGRKKKQQKIKLTKKSTTLKTFPGKKIHRGGEKKSVSLEDALKALAADWVRGGSRSHSLVGWALIDNGSSRKYRP